MVLILADSVAGAQWGMGQKGIDMANLNDRRDAETTMPGKRPGIVLKLIGSVGETQPGRPALLSLAACGQAVIQRHGDHQAD